MQRRSLLAAAAGEMVTAAVARTSADAQAPPARAVTTGRPVTTFNVISDIQGDLGDLGVALRAMRVTNPGSSGLAERLAYWKRLRKPVMVITHHPLPDTVSGSRNKLYLRDYLQAERRSACRHARGRHSRRCEWRPGSRPDQTLVKHIV
ncbi:hypothetical protein [Streptomyces noursei]|uniref:Uncharacterized protein n=1 Tax=Streptomyces noursei TaxID=1971 RepID=A0A2N8P818_STRNR|nr:hypothetical protein AOB60_22465 [Streptomyces noursei]